MTRPVAPRAAPPAAMKWEGRKQNAALRRHSSLKRPNEDTKCPRASDALLPAMTANENQNHGRMKCRATPAATQQSWRKPGSAICADGAAWHCSTGYAKSERKPSRQQLQCV